MMAEDKEELPKKEYKSVFDETTKGVGSGTSRIIAKETSGRSFVTSGRSEHQGHSGAHITEDLASRRLEKSMPKKAPTKSEWEILEEMYPSDVKLYQDSGFTREQIRDILENN
jgi:hypothetical protein